MFSDVFFKIGSPGELASPEFLVKELLSKLRGPRSFGLTFDPASITLDWDDAMITPWVRSWGQWLRLMHVTAPRESLEASIGLFRRLAPSCTILLEHPSLADQNEVAEWLRDLLEEPDALGLLEKT